MKTQLYLRDLKPDLYYPTIDQWKIDKRKRLLKALKERKDIAIGEYYEEGKEKIVD